MNSDKIFVSRALFGKWTAGRINLSRATLSFGADAEKAQFWIQEFKVDDLALFQSSFYDLANMQAANFGLIGVFDDAPFTENDAIYKIRGNIRQFILYFNRNIR